MITDNQTNKVYFSAWLAKDFPAEYEMIIRLLDKYAVPHALLPQTKDYWCRDYMPIQIAENVFVEYKYTPDYLLRNARNRKFISDSSKICKELGIKTVQSDIILDGGNVIKTEDTIIMTEKIFKENPQYTEKQLIDRIENLFQSELLLLPWDTEEPYGHSDGIVRYIAGKDVLLTNYADFNPYLAGEMERRLSRKFHVKVLAYDTAKNDSNNWAYINFLQTKELIIIPALGIAEDQQAKAQFESFFPDYNGKIEQTDVRAILKLGGALNCISWNIKM